MLHLKQQGATVLIFSFFECMQGPSKEKTKEASSKL
jgi:hypothetical protein